MSNYYYNVQKKGADKRAREWRAEVEELMEGNREFVRWEVWAYGLFETLALLPGILFYNFISFVVKSASLPAGSCALRPNE
jgi:hypothetical protein